MRHCGPGSTKDTDPSLLPRFSRQDTNSYSGSDGNGIGSGGSTALQVCLLEDLVCLGNSGAVVVGALGADAVSSGSALTGDGKKGSVAVAKSHGLFGLGAADAANLCLANNCLGGGGALVLGNATAGAVGGAIPQASSSSSSLKTSSTTSASRSLQKPNGFIKKKVKAGDGPPVFLFGS